jgi:hypothetical protein
MEKEYYTMDEPFEVQTNDFYVEFEVNLGYMRNNAYNQVSPQSNAPEMSACFQQQMYGACRSPQNLEICNSVTGRMVKPGRFETAVLPHISLYFRPLQQHISALWNVLLPQRSTMPSIWKAAVRSATTCINVMNVFKAILDESLIEQAKRSNTTLGKCSLPRPHSYSKWLGRCQSTQKTSYNRSKDQSENQETNKNDEPTRNLGRLQRWVITFDL